jgi:hypothetical protein
MSAFGSQELGKLCIASLVRCYPDPAYDALKAAAKANVEVSRQIALHCKEVVIAVSQEMVGVEVTTPSPTNITYLKGFQCVYD